MSEKMEEKLENLYLQAQNLWQGEKTLHRGVGGLRRALSKVENAPAREGEQVAARKLLGAIDFDLGKLEDVVGALKKLPRESVEVSPSAGVGDIDGYLQQHHEHVMSRVVQEARKSTTERCLRLYDQYLEDSWEKNKQQLLRGFAQRKTGLWASEGRVDVKKRRKNMSKEEYMDRKRQPYMQIEHTKVVRASLPEGGAPASQRGKILAFATSVCKVGGKRRAGDPVGIVDEFMKVSKDQDDHAARKEEVLDGWKIVKGLIDSVRPIPSTDKKQRMLTQLKSARHFLEKQYLSVMEMYVAAHPEESKRGGKPGSAELIAGALRGGFEDGLDFRRVSQTPPLWAWLFYCLRCGEVAEAVKVSQRYRSVLGDTVVSLLERFLARDVSVSTEDEQYCLRESRAAADKDIYKAAVYSLLGSCKGDALEKVAMSTMQDWLWAKMCILDGEAQTGSVEKSLEELQVMIRGHEGYFTSGGSPLLYFQALLLTQQFAEAVDYLLASDRFYVEAVHFGMVLDEARLLASAGKLEMDEIVRRYVDPFTLSSPLVAVEYYSLLQDEVAKKRRFAELVKETKDYDVLLGGIGVSGERHKGAVEWFCKDDKESRQIIRDVAVAMERAGSLGDAILLYDLAGGHSAVLLLLVRRIGEAHFGAIDNGDGIVDLAKNISRRYYQNGILKAMQRAGGEELHALRSFEQVLSIVDYFVAIREGNRKEALRALRDMGILPVDLEGLSERVAGFEGLEDSVKRAIPDLLLTAMQLAHDEAAAVRKRVTRPSEDATLLQLKAMSRAISNFAGRIKFRLPGDVTAKLLRLEVLTVDF